MCIYDALTIVAILSVKELKKKKKALKCVFFASTVKTIRNLFIYFQLCASFLVWLQIFSAFLKNGVIKLRNSVK